MIKKCIFVFLVLFLAGCFDPGEQLAEKEYKKTYADCYSELDGTDTSRNTALLTIQSEYARHDNLSRAPTRSSEAIKMICEVKAQAAKDKANGIVNLSEEKKPSKNSNSKVK